ncbi:MAG: PIN domain-containing protein [Acidimicrobiia bacterium]|nr:PIN domain-containing protein [Acidimicrobiia bacterium]
MAFYLDTSAAVKLVVAEAESTALGTWLREHDDEIVSSDLLRTELLRATRRGAPEQMPRARLVLDSVILLTVASTTFERAGEVATERLRSLDALHLSAALELGDELDGMVTYDDRLGHAARLHGIIVITPR